MAVAAGILLALSFSDLFPEALQTSTAGAVAGFSGGFAFLFVVEVFTRAHTHHSLDDSVHKHALGLFTLGLGIHNFADGFVLGASADLPGVVAGGVGLGVLLHQIPVGVSLAAVLAATRASRATVLRTALPLGLIIPLAAGLTTALPVPGYPLSSALTEAAGGALAYMGSAHLLPEVQAERPGGHYGAQGLRRSPARATPASVGSRTATSMPPVCARRSPPIGWASYARRAGRSASRAACSSL